MDNKYIPVYIWINNFRSIKNQGFHFNNEWNYSYDQEKNILTRTKNDNYIKELYGESIAVSAIVGENGAGKTTLLSAIMESLSFSNKNNKYILVFSNNAVWEKDNEKINCYSFRNITDLKIKLEKPTKIYSFYSNRIPITCVYYSQALDWAQFLNNNKGIINLSSGNLLNSYRNTDNIKAYSVRKYFTEEFIKQIRFIEDMQNENENSIGFKLPNQVTIAPVYCDHEVIVDYLTEYVLKKINGSEQDILKDIIIQNGFTEEQKITRALFAEKFYKKRDKSFIKEYFRYIINKFAITRANADDHFIEKFKSYLTLNIFYALCNTFGERYSSGIPYYYLIKSLNIAINKRNFKGADKWKRLNILFNVVCNDKKPLIDDSSTGINVEIIQIKDLYDYFNNVLFHKYNDSYKDNQNNSFSFSIPLKECEANESFPFKIAFNEFWENYKNIALNNDMFELSWNMSSGEICRLELYSRLYDITISKRWNPVEYKLLNPMNSILLLIDEADMLLHPEWQRTFINDIIDALPKIFKNHYISVILATHSPIMLSDIPKQNVLYLSNTDTDTSTMYDMQPETFGANIFKLYNNAFFLDKGAIGAFAKKELEVLLAEIISGKGKKHELQKKINMIGDDFLKGKFQSQFDNIYNKTSRIDDEISILEKKVQKLKEEKERIEKKEKERALNESQEGE